MKSFLVSLLLYSWTLLACADPAIQVENAWVREAPPGAQMMAAYMTLKNTGSSDVTLENITSPAFRMVMLHKSVIVDGVARMSHQDSLPIPAGTSVALEPGSFHLMMPAPEQRLHSGDQVEFNLRFADGRTVQVQATVRKKP